MSRRKRRFAQGWCISLGPGKPVSDTTLSTLRLFSSQLEQRFAVETRGRGSLMVNWPSEDGPTQPSDPGIVSMPDPAGGDADLASAVSWLLAQQGEDGEWSDKPATTVRDTAAALAALSAQSGALPYAAGREFLRQYSYRDNDDRAWASWRSGDDYVGESPAGVDSWGLTHGLNGSWLDTVLVARALAEHGDVPRDLRLSILEALEAGPLPIADGGAPSLLATSVALQATARTGASPNQVNGALNWIIGARNADGGVGLPVSTSQDTAMALLTLSFWPDFRPGVIADLQSVLEARQAAMEAWDNSVFATAISLIALRSLDLTNLRLRDVESAGSVVDGQVFPLTVLIENDSGRVAPPTTLRSSINGVTAGEVPVDENGAW